MRIGIIGSGHIGGTAAALFARAGHEVLLSHASGPGSLGGQVAALGPRARAATVDEAARDGDVVLLALPWRRCGDLPADALRGKIVVDATNPYRPDHRLYDLHGSTSSEEVAHALPGARLVKAFNTLPAADLARRGEVARPVEERTALPVAGDDPDAKRVVAGLILEVGFAPVDTGALREGGRLQQPGGPLYARPVSGADATAALRGAGQPAGDRAGEHPGHA